MMVTSSLLVLLQLFEDEPDLRDGRPRRLKDLCCSFVAGELQACKMEGYGGTVVLEAHAASKKHQDAAREAGAAPFIHSASFSSKKKSRIEDEAHQVDRNSDAPLAQMFKSQCEALNVDFVVTPVQTIARMSPATIPGDPVEEPQNVGGGIDGDSAPTRADEGDGGD